MVSIERKPRLVSIPTQRPLLSPFEDPCPALKLPPTYWAKAFPRPYHMCDLSRNKAHRYWAIMHAIQSLGPISIVSFDPDMTRRDLGNWVRIRRSGLDFVALQGDNTLYGYDFGVVRTPRRGRDPISNGRPNITWAWQRTGLRQSSPFPNP